MKYTICYLAFPVVGLLASVMLGPFSFEPDQVEKEVLVYKTVEVYKPLITWTLEELPEPPPHEAPQWIDFMADWCQPCVPVSADLNRLKTSGWEYSEDETAQIRKVNIDNSLEMKEKYQIEQIPCLVLVHRGNVVKRYTGRNEYPGHKKIAEEYIAAWGDRKLTSKGAPKKAGNITRSQVNEIIDFLASADGKVVFTKEKKVKLGSMEGVFPQGCEITNSKDGKRLNIANKKPFIRWGKVSQELAGIAFEDAQIRLELPWMFDVTIEIDDDPKPPEGEPST